MWKLMKQLSDRFYEINPSRTESLQSRPSDQEFRRTCVRKAKSPEQRLLDVPSYVHVSAGHQAEDEELLRGWGIQDDKMRTLGFSWLDRYLRKINSFVHGFEVLVNAAMSPRCRRLFAYQATVRSPPKWTTKLDHVVNTTEDWERVLEKAVVYTNSRPRHEDGKAESHVMGMAVISEDTALMAREDITDTLVVHCEVKLLLALQKSHDEQKSIPRAHPCIGGSKLSCNGCDCFFGAFNNTHHTNWKTGGTHGKSYYPWMFPCTFPEQDVVGKFTYSIIAERWVQLYRGYRVSQSTRFD